MMFAKPSWLEMKKRWSDPRDDKDDELYLGKESPRNNHVTQYRAQINAGRPQINYLSNVVPITEAVSWLKS